MEEMTKLDELDVVAIARLVDVVERGYSFTVSKSLGYYNIDLTTNPRSQPYTDYVRGCGMTIAYAARAALFLFEKHDAVYAAKYAKEIELTASHDPGVE